MQQRFVIGQATDPGLKRGKGPNQDSIGIAEQAGSETGCPMLILADGMGGYYGGEIASRTAVETVKEVYSASDPEKTGFQTVLSECIESAHRKIGENAAADELLSSMGSTVVLAVPTETSVWIGNVGDSRAYLITSQGKISQISYDHSLVMEQFRAGLITKEEADHHPWKNVLTMSLSGQRGEVDPYIREIPWKTGDCVLICSDGLWGPVPEDQICSTVTSMEPQEAADRLVELANRNGGPDNISVLIVRNDGKPSVPDPVNETEAVTAPEPAAESRHSGRRLMILGLILVLLILVLVLYLLKYRAVPLSTFLRDGSRFLPDGRI